MNGLIRLRTSVKALSEQGVREPCLLFKEVYQIILLWRVWAFFVQGVCQCMLSISRHVEHGKKNDKVQYMSGKADSLKRSGS